MLLVGLFQPLEGVGGVAQAGVDEGDLEGSDILALAFSAVQIVENLQGLEPSASHGIGVAQGGEGEFVGVGKLDCVLELTDGVGRQAFLLVGQGAEEITPEVVRNHGENLRYLVERLVRLPGVNIMPGQVNISEDVLWIDSSKLLALLQR